MFKLNNPFGKQINEVIDGETIRPSPNGIPNTSTPNMEREQGWYLVDGDAPISQRFGSKQEAEEYKRTLMGNPAYRAQLQRAQAKFWDGKMWQLNEEVNEERSLSDNAASLIERATSICMNMWYDLTGHFNSNPDKYDPYQVNPDDKFMHFKLAPGGDAREETYEKILDATNGLCKKLNDALGRTLFKTEIEKRGEHFKATAKYAEGSGAIFQIKSKEGDVGVIIQMTMPRQGIVRNAFRSLITTPEFPIGDAEDIPDAPGVEAPKNPYADEEPDMSQEAPKDNFRGAPLTSDNMDDKVQLKLNKEAFSEIEEGLKVKVRLTFGGQSREEIGTIVQAPYDQVGNTGFGDYNRQLVDVELDKYGVVALEVSDIIAFKKNGKWVSFNFESVNEGKRPAQGYDAPEEPGYYVVYGSHTSGPEAEWTVVSQGFETKDDAVAAKNDIMSQRRAEKGFAWNRLSAESYHVKYWDGDEYHQTTFDTRLGDLSGKESPEQISRLQRAANPTDDSPLSSDEYEDAEGVEVPANYVNKPDIGFKIKPKNEEVAANAVSTGALKGGNASGDPYADVRTAVKNKKTSEKAQATKMWKRANEGYNDRDMEEHFSYFSFSGGLFRK